MSSAPEPGDFLLTRSPGWLCRAIRLGERLKVGNPYAHWNHAALVVGWTGKAALVIMAESRGVLWSYIAPGPNACWVRTGLDQRGRQLAVQFAKQALGRKYGFVTIASIILNTLTPRFIDFLRPGTFICSGLVARCLAQGGAQLPVAWDLAQVSPADLAKQYGVRR